MDEKRRRYGLVLRLIGALARVVFGFALASFAAGLVIVMFVNTPAEVLSEPASRLPQTANETFGLALLTATHAAIFAAAFVLIAAGLGEWFSIRSLPYYLIAGIAISALGFIAELASEVAGQPTILNNYALKAFLTTGFFAGFVYWLASGQFAGSPPEVESASSDIVPVSEHDTAEPAESVSADADGETSVVITKPNAEAVQPIRQASLLSRLKFARRGDPKAEDDEPDAGEFATETDGSPASDASKGDQAEKDEDEA